MKGSVMPEAGRLRLLYWQFFVTLTFRTRRLSSPARKCLLFAWLRDVAEAEPKTHFKRLLWLSRYEVGPNGGCGHYHLCIAGKSVDSVTIALCDNLERLWRARTGALAEITPYDHARDGVGYILKMSAPFQPVHTGQDMVFGNDNDETYPTLSKSLFATLRRGRM